VGALVVVMVEEERGLINDIDIRRLRRIRLLLPPLPFYFWCLVVYPPTIICPNVALINTTQHQKIVVLARSSPWF